MGGKLSRAVGFATAPSTLPRRISSASSLATPAVLWNLLPSHRTTLPSPTPVFVPLSVNCRSEQRRAFPRFRGSCNVQTGNSNTLI